MHSNFIVRKLQFVSNENSSEHRTLTHSFSIKLSTFSITLPLCTEMQKLTLVSVWMRFSQYAIHMYKSPHLYTIQSVIGIRHTYVMHNALLWKCTLLNSLKQSWSETKSKEKNIEKPIPSIVCFLLHVYPCNSYRLTVSIFTQTISNWIKNYWVE